jgi:hypothetical protein
MRTSGSTIGTRPPSTQDGAPLGEARAQGVVPGDAIAQAVQPLRHLLTRSAGEGLGAAVDLDPGNDALRSEQLGERGAVRCALVDCLVEEDDAADELLGAFRREEDLAVDAAVRFGGLDVDGVEALLDGRGAFVGRENASAGRHHRSRRRCQFRHFDALHGGSEAARGRFPAPTGRRRLLVGPIAGKSVRVPANSM